MPGSNSGRYTFPGDFVPAAPDRGHTLKALGFRHSVLKEALNGIHTLPFVLSLSKDLFKASLTALAGPVSAFRLSHLGS